MPSCKQHTERLTGKEIDCPFCEIQKCYIEINNLTEKLDEEINIQHTIAGDANKLEESLRHLLRDVVEANLQRKFSHEQLGWLNKFESRICKALAENGGQ